jgi:small-conductance mechanosensitive channel
MEGAGGLPHQLISLFNYTTNIWRYILPVAIIAGCTLVGEIVEFIVKHRVSRKGAKSRWRGNQAIMRALRHKIVTSGLLLGVAIALNFIPWPIGGTELDLLRKALLVGFLIVLTILASDIVGSLLLASQREEAHLAVSIIDTLIRAAIYVIGAIIILQQIFHYDLGPALAALGVAGLAVSLALQATLTDLISGIQIITAGQYRPGDYVRLSTGEEGYVTDVGWRTTTIRELSNNLIIVPNSKITSTVLENFSTPATGSMSILVDLGVAFDSDLEKVERITVEVAKEVLASVPGGVTDDDPFIRYNAIGDSRINFTVILRAKHYTDQYLIKHTLIRSLIKRYREEHIQIPYPVRTVELQHVDVQAVL